MNFPIHLVGRSQTVVSDTVTIGFFSVEPYNSPVASASLAAFSNSSRLYFGGTKQTAIELRNSRIVAQTFVLQSPYILMDTEYAAVQIMDTSSTHTDIVATVIPSGTGNDNSIPI